MQQSTAWQQRQQQQGRQRPTKQRGHRGTPPSQLQQLQQLQAANNAGRFSSCQTFQALYKALQEQVVPANTQPEPQQWQQQQANSQLDGADIRADPSPKVPTASPMQQQQQPQQQQPGEVKAGQPAQMQLLQFSARDCVGVVNQLGAITRSQQSSGSSTNPFVEDQALQHSLALVSERFASAFA
jgi:hypothetical protein